MAKTKELPEDESGKSLEYLTSVEGKKKPEPESERLAQEIIEKGAFAAGVKIRDEEK